MFSFQMHQKRYTVANFTLNISISASEEQFICIAEYPGACYQMIVSGSYFKTLLMCNTSLRIVHVLNYEAMTL
jgi:hypothetical protein